MNEKCAQKDIRFVVVIIPTKEMVFSRFLEQNSELPLTDGWFEEILPVFVEIKVGFPSPSDSTM